MGVSDFIFYFGIVTGFAAWILGITQQLQNLDMVATECDHFRAFLEMPDRPRLQSASALPAKGAQPCSITFENVDFRYQGSKSLTLKQMSFTVQPGEKIAIVGENGAGKTTLIRMAVGLAAPSGGSIELFGSKDLTQMRKKVGTVIEYPAVIPHMTARQNLVAQCKLQGVKDLSVIDRILSTVGLESTGKKKAKNFSLGMKQRLAIAIALIGEPDFLF